MNISTSDGEYFEIQCLFYRLGPQLDGSLDILELWVEIPFFENFIGGE
jgi:hypothetical protein